MELNQDVRHKQLVALSEEYLKRRCLENFPLFVEKIINYDHRWQIADFQIEVMKAVQICQQILLLLPRGHGKSELITIAYPIWRMCRDPNIKILIRNENSDNAEKFLSAIKDILTQNQLLISLFGNFKADGKRWNSDQIDIAQRTIAGIKDPTVATGGLNKSMVGGHFNLIIDDDLVSDRNSQTKVMTDKVIEFHKNTPPLADERDFQWITIGTRWTYYDLYNHIMQFEPHVKVIKKQAIAKDGTILFPEVFTYESLMQKKAQLGTYFFSCQYQNNPVDDQDAIFKHSWVEKMGNWRIEDLPKNINTFILIDPAVSQERRSDYTSILVVSMDANGELYLRQLVREKLTLDEMIQKVFQFVDRYHPELVGLETNAFQKVLGTYFYDQMDKEKFYFQLKQYSWHINKEVRIRKLQPYFERGAIHADKRMEHFDDLEYELLKFPKGEHEDAADTLASALSVCYPPEPERILEKEEVDLGKLVIERMFKLRDEQQAQEAVYDLISPYDSIETL